MAGARSSQASAGLTLIEVLLALALLTVVALATSAWLRRTMYFIDGAAERQAAADAWRAAGALLQADAFAATAPPREDSDAASGQALIWSDSLHDPAGGLGSAGPLHWQIDSTAPAGKDEEGASELYRQTGGQRRLVVRLPGRLTFQEDDQGWWLLWQEPTAPRPRRCLIRRLAASAPLQEDF